MTAARQTIAGTEDEFMTLDLVSPVGAIQRALILESEALPAVLAVKAAAPALRELGLRHLSISVGPGGGLVLVCQIGPAIEDEYLPKRDLGATMMRAAQDAGGWVDDLIFQTAEAQSGQARSASSAQPACPRRSPPRMHSTGKSP